MLETLKEFLLIENDKISIKEIICAGLMVFGFPVMIVLSLYILIG